MYLVKHKPETLPVAFQNYFETNENAHKYSTRQKEDYKIPKTKKTWGDKMIKTKGARLWNALEKNLKSSSSVKSFCTQFKKFKISTY